MDTAVPQAADAKSNLLRISEFLNFSKMWTKRKHQLPFLICVAAEAAGTKKFVQQLTTRLNYNTNYSSIVKKLAIVRQTFYEKNP